MKYMGTVTDKSWTGEREVVLICPQDLEYEAWRLINPDYQDRRIYTDEIPRPSKKKLSVMRMNAHLNNYPEMTLSEAYQVGS